MNQAYLQTPQTLPRTARQKVVFRLPLWLTLLAFLGPILARDLYGVSVPRIFFTVVLGVCFWFSEENMDLALFVATLTFNTRIDYNEITLVFLVIYLMRRFKEIKLPNFSLLFVAVLLLELTDTLVASGDVLVFFRFSALMIVAMLLLVTPTTRHQLTRIFSSFLIGFSCALYDVLTLTFRQMTLDQFLRRGYRLGTVERILESEDGASDAVGISVGSGDITNFNPNMLACFAGVAIFVLFLMWYTKRINTLLALPVGGFILFGALLTQGRAMLLSLFFFVLLILFNSMRSTKSFLLTVFVMILFAIVMILLVDGPLAGVYERYLERFAMNDITNGRSEIWERIMTALTSDFRAFFVGFGIRYYADFTGGSSAHNTIFEVLASWGVLGFATLFTFNVCSVRHQMRQTERFQAKKKIPLIYFAPLFSFLFSLLGTHLYTITVYACVFSIAQSAVRLCDYEEERALPKEERHRLNEEQKAKKLSDLETVSKKTHEETV